MLVFRHGLEFNRGVASVYLQKSRRMVLAIPPRYYALGFPEIAHVLLVPNRYRPIHILYFGHRSLMPLLITPAVCRYDRYRQEVNFRNEKCELGRFFRTARLREISLPNSESPMASFR